MPHRTTARMSTRSLKIVDVVTEMDHTSDASNTGCYFCLSYSFYCFISVGIDRRTTKLTARMSTKNANETTVHDIGMGLLYLPILFVSHV